MVAGRAFLLLDYLEEISENTLKDDCNQKLYEREVLYEGEICCT